MTTLETKKDSAAETGKKLHASIKLACSKKYTTTHSVWKLCDNAQQPRMHLLL